MDLKEFRKILSTIQKAMVERGISFDDPLDSWCPYRPEADAVIRKTPGLRRTGGAWRTESDLWVCNNVLHNTWGFKNCRQITYEEIKNFCEIHDIMGFVPPEIYGEKTSSKYHVTTEVEFMDI